MDELIKKWGTVPPASDLGSALTAKYRPFKLSEFWNYPRDPALRQLVREMQTNTLRSVLIFIAPFSGAKTSAAKFLGQWASCLRWRTDPLPCGECDTCHTVMYGRRGWRSGLFEVDSTAARAEDYIKEAFYESACSLGFNFFDRITDNPRPKVAFIDEVQRLPLRLQKSILKRTEQTNDIVVVLATDDKSRIDEGLLSRGYPPYCFTHPIPEEAAPHLVRIARSESFELPADLALILGEAGKGIPRHCLNLLQSTISATVDRGGRQISRSDVMDVCGNELKQGQIDVTEREVG